MTVPKPKGQSPKPASARTTIAVQGARVHNLKNISVEIPRDRLIVITGLSGSGKSSLAFDTIYAEGQRRYMESLSSYAKRFVAQVAKPDVDFVFGLSPVISIEQKTGTNNPRSTVGTMTDIVELPEPPLRHDRRTRTARARVNRCRPGRRARSSRPSCRCPKGRQIELRAPVFKVYGEDLEFVFTEVRKKGFRRLIVDGKPVDLADKVELDESAVHQHRRRRRSVRGQPEAREGDQGGYRRGAAGRRRPAAAPPRQRSRARRRRERFYEGLGSRTQHFIYGDIGARLLRVQQPRERVPHLRRPRRGQADASRSAGARSEAQHRRRLFRPQAYKYNPETWDGRVMYSLSKVLGFSLDKPWKDLPEEDPPRDSLWDRQEVTLTAPPEAKLGREKWEGHETAFHGIARRIERYYRRYRQRGETSSKMEAWLDKVMVERTCADCNGARAARDAAAVRPSPARPSTTSASSTSTSCTRSSAR